MSQPWTAARVARPVADLARSTAFYGELLGLPRRGGFTGHDGYDGVFFALPGGTELELTAGDAIIHRRVEKKDEYAVIEWSSEGGLAVRSSTTDKDVAHALAVAGLHEIEELVADEISDLPGEPPRSFANGNGNGAANGAASGGAAPASDEPRNFEEFIYKVWGAGIAKHFAIPYNRKIWAVDLKEMETSWLGGRVPLPDLGEMIQGALEPAPAPMGPNARFGYPLKGGFQALMDGFLPHVQDRLLLEFTAGSGFIGIAVALMGRSHPVGIVLAAILFGILFQAARSSPSTAPPSPAT